MNKKKIIKFAKNNFFVIIFFLVILFVGIVSVFKITKPNTTYVYVKIKLGQGLWWTGYQRPGIWLAKAIKKGDYERDLLGKKIAEVEEVKFYPYYNTDQFDIFVIAKLQVGGGPKSGKYSFKRSDIGTGSPIELELTGTQISGSVTDLQTSPFQDNLIEKTIIIYKRNAYPWEYEAVKIGDKYFDGSEDIFEITGKNSTDTLIFSTDSIGNQNTNTTEQKKYIMVKAKVKLKEIDGQYVLGEDQVLRAGKLFNFSTRGYTFTEYIVGKIE